MGDISAPETALVNNLPDNTLWSNNNIKNQNLTQNKDLKCK